MTPRRLAEAFDSRSLLNAARRYYCSRRSGGLSAPSDDEIEVAATALPVPGARERLRTRDGCAGGRWPEREAERSRRRRVSAALDGASVAIDYTVSPIKGKGLCRKPTKSAAGQRTLPLPSSVAMILRDRLAEALEDERPAGQPRLSEFDRWPAGCVEHAAGIPSGAGGTEGFEWVTSHVFRKTAATILDDADLSSRLIADQLGHSKPSMTQDVYLARKVISARTAAALEGVFGQASGE